MIILTNSAAMLLRPNEVLHQLPEAWPPKFVFGVMGTS
jgi:hypothetical protein